MNGRHPDADDDLKAVLHLLIALSALGWALLVYAVVRYGW